jgi:hypothetical protein
MLMALNKELEIVNDSFYFKKESNCEACKFAYLHLSENGHEMFLAYFENREVEEPIVYRWEEDDYSIKENSRHFIVEFIGEAYLSLYIKAGKEKPVDKPLWRHTSGTNCGIPSKWWDKVKDIEQKILKI